MKTILLSALALGAFTTAATAEPAVPPPPPAPMAALAALPTTGPNAPVALTDLQMDAVRGGAPSVYIPLGGPYLWPNSGEPFDPPGGPTPQGATPQALDAFFENVGPAIGNIFYEPHSPIEQVNATYGAKPPSPLPPSQ